MFPRAALLVTVLAALPATYAFWIFGGTQPLVTTRLDSIVSPGIVSTHVHSVVGGSRFQASYDYNDLSSSQCSTISVQEDRSNYWAPQLYYHDQNANTFTPIPTSFNIYYLQRPGPANERVQAFPTGLRMLAGNPLRRTNNASNFEDQAISFHCLDSQDHTGDPAWDERPDFFQHQCPDAMRAQVFFPTCWDGNNLDSADHKSHMAYPIQNYNGGDCPASHPVHLVSLFYEMFVSVDQFPYAPGNWVFSFGDTTGLGMHADFQDGWTDKGLLQTALDQCTEANGADGDVSACTVLQPYINRDFATACKPEMTIPNENVGFTGTLNSLPGCNLIWSDTSPKPTCNPNPPTPGFVSVKTPLPSGWAEVGCTVEGTNGRALTGASTTSPTMTKAECANFCAADGFPYAGVEYGDECYCGQSFSNGASSNTVGWQECSTTCAGNPNEDCGGPNRLTLLYNPSV
ncbi:hypothetical protein EUX98_g1633 [Antrodiella citrinella]|uniref:WSC domain-containing protein n=1 Tax=Antrodiella citrinella TaxID=2447956 RepID=A0A4S4N0Y2_9APHY|nr:hypothetical protein EUX98_g1633 [Antrodiella citrinella]